MEIVLFRHGIAEESHPEHAGDDAARRLTEEGREKCRKVAEFLKEKGFRWDHCVHSGLKRAEETAHILTKKNHAKKESVCDELSPGGDPLLALRVLRNYSGDILVVGHEPNLCRLSALLLGSKVPFFGFKKAGFAVLELDSWDKPGQLMAFLSPKYIL